MTDDLFLTAPQEVIDYFDRRGTRTSWRWTDLAPHEHALGFTVARTAEFDVIEDLRTATRKAAVDRLPFEQFVEELTPILKAKGWWGEKKIRGEKVQLGSLRRLKTIYWANVRSAHAAGEWAKTQAHKGFLPFLRYKVSLAAEKRKEHLGWVGTTLPVDHRWWRTHYPPNGWHCQCRVEQIGEVAAGKTPPEQRKAPPLNTRLWQDKRSGKVWRVPEGIDPGWQTNPGLTRERMAAIAQAGRIAVFNHSARSTMIAGLRTSAAFAHIAGNGAGLPYPLPRSPRTDAQIAAARALTPVASIDLPGVDLAGPAYLSGEDAAKMQIKHRVVIADYDLLQRLLDKPDAVVKDGSKVVVAGMIDGKPWKATVKVTVHGLILLNSFHRIQPGKLEALRKSLLDQRG